MRGLPSVEMLIVCCGVLSSAKSRFSTPRRCGVWDGPRPAPAPVFIGGFGGRGGGCPSRTTRPPRIRSGGPARQQILEYGSVIVGPRGRAELSGDRAFEMLIGGDAGVEDGGELRAGPASMAGLEWLVRVGPVPMEAWGCAMGWGDRVARSHASRLEREGWLERHRMLQGRRFAAGRDAAGRADDRAGGVGAGGAGADVVGA